VRSILRKRPKFVLVRVSSMKTQTSVVYPALMALLSQPPAREVRTILLAAVHASFEGLVFQTRQVPHRNVADDDPARGQLDGQRPHADIGPLCQPAEQKAPFVNCEHALGKSWSTNTSFH